MNDCIVATVYTPGPDYDLNVVERLRAQIPGLVVFGIDIPLRHNWPGWWAKMNLFDPSLFKDILYFDLDTLITGPIDEYKTLGRTCVLSDFIYPGESIGSGMMYIAQRDKAAIWAHFELTAQLQMDELHGDQDYLKYWLFDKAARWQDLYPGQIISYKKHLVPTYKFYESGFCRHNANVICFHGKPRPWLANDEWIKQHYRKGKQQ